MMIRNNPTNINDTVLHAADTYLKYHKELIKLREVLRIMRHSLAYIERNAEGSSIQHHEKELAHKVFNYGSVDDVTEQCTQLKLFMDLLKAKMLVTIRINTIDDPEPEPELEPESVSELETERPLEIPGPFYECPTELK